ncbi:M20/M25/M40 family metallo-hydrolase [Luteolibacter sp. GHJ8]|uniref:M20/M25/M40 family metallo-hydrolase n=1 Tax=Luteolibacter rhizosphaerae TaxID=2989719 RepID=A0ABT3FXD5_9BACT|nr:M20/M25/M40 family metallo-hydrolase [Luteolibacter rhizosphaerae]MCW1912238.1 M20/M25/M40 family metallo-hydrolase [Luteolibacter rhizosphaerae]
MTGPVELLQQLVRIPSVNPDNPAGSDKTGEAEIAAWLKNWLESFGAAVVLEEIRPGRPNLIARFAPRDGRPRILLGPHLDTVGVGSMTIDPFSGEIRDGRVWGRGSSDTKGPMAAMLWGLKENASILKDLPIAVDFVGFMGEESSQWGSKDFAKHHAHDYAFAIVGEPTSLNIVHTTKGSLWATLRASGKAAHSSQPERGDNAAMKLARALDTLEREIVPKLAGYIHPVLGRSTFNVGVLRSGSRPNIVPDLADAEIDIRITPALRDAGGALALLKAEIDRLDLPLEMVKPHENPPMEIPATHPWIDRIQDVRTECKAVGAPWFSDAAHLSNAGLASVCMGPGSIDQAHTCDEFIDIAALEEGAAFFTNFIRSLA